MDLLNNSASVFNRFGELYVVLARWTCGCLMKTLRFYRKKSSIYNCLLAETFS